MKIIIGMIILILGLILVGIFIENKKKGEVFESEPCPRITYFTENLTNSKQIDCHGNIIWETDDEGNFGFGSINDKEEGILKVGIKEGKTAP